ncbi:hypothetical protein GX48_07270 [Paracoccidioides brasiliensis]|nr:hypothetical protein GX48_07270 [Paracoccidioides brasiliensis]
MGSAEWEINPHAYQPKGEEWIEQELKTGGEFFQNNSPGDRADITENRMDIGGPVRRSLSKFLTRQYAKKDTKNATSFTYQNL